MRNRCFVTRTVALLALCGCATSGAQLGADAVQSMDALGSDLAAAGNQINVVMVALDDLTLGTDLARAHERFTGACSKLESLAGRSASAARSLESRGDAFYARWERDLDAITSPLVRERSAQRAAASRERFERIAANVSAVKEAFDVLLVDLSDLRTYLEYDLNAEGVFSARDLITVAREDGAMVQGLIAQVQAQLTQVAAAMSAGAGG